MENNPAPYELTVKPGGGAWIESHVTREWPIVKGAKYLMEPVEEIGPRGIYAVAYKDGAVTFDRPGNITRRQDIKRVYQFTGEYFLDLDPDA